MVQSPGCTAFIDYLYSPPIFVFCDTDTWKTLVTSLVDCLTFVMIMGDFVFGTKHAALSVLFPARHSTGSGALCVLAGNVNFDHLWKIMCAQFLHYEVTFSSFSLISTFWEPFWDYTNSSLWSYFVPNFNIYPWSCL